MEPESSLPYSKVSATVPILSQLHPVPMTKDCEILPLETPKPQCGVGYHTSKATMWCEISYFQNHNVVWDILPKPQCGVGYHTSKTTTWCRLSYFLNHNVIPNPTPFHSWLHFIPKTTEIVFFHTDTNSAAIYTVLKKRTTSIFRQPTEDTSHIFLQHTAPQTTCYSNPQYYFSSPEVKYFKIYVTTLWMVHSGKTEWQV
jgi:hypothetical protein